MSKRTMFVGAALFGIAVVFGACGKSTNPTNNNGGGGGGTANIVIVDSLHLPGLSVGEPVKVGNNLALYLYSDSLFIINPVSGLVVLTKSYSIYPVGSYNDMLFATNAGGYLCIYNVGSSGTLSLLGSAPFGFGMPYSHGNSGTNLYESTEGHFYTIDASNPASITISDSLRGFRISRIDVGGTKLIVSAWDSIAVMDITNPAHPVITALFPSADEAVDAAFHGSTVYIAERKAGVRIFQLPNVATPVGSIPAVNDSTDYVVCWSDTLVVGTGSRLLAYDVADPAHPKKIGEATMPGIIYGVLHSSGLFVATTRWVEGSVRLLKVAFTPN